MTRVRRLGVKLYGKEIGVIDSLPGERAVFYFQDSYVDDSNRPTLGLAFKDEYGELRQEFRAFRMQLMPFFSNLLPEGHLLEYLARRAGVKSVREFHTSCAPLDRTFPAPWSWRRRATRVNRVMQSKAIPHPWTVAELRDFEIHNSCVSRSPVCN